MITRLLSELEGGADLKKILEATPLKLGNWPTPIQPLDEKLKLWVKRDDLSAYGRGGIKTRKLEGILSYLKEGNYTNVVLLVPNISNLRSDLELFQQTHSPKIDLNLFISDIPKINPRDRVKIKAISSNEYKLTGRNGMLISIQLLWKYLELRLKGKRPLLLLPSILHPAAVMGASQGIIETFLQFQDQGISFPKEIYISACTGSSAAGLILGLKVLEMEGMLDKSVRVNVVKTFRGPLKKWIWLALRWTIFKYDLKISIPLREVSVIEKVTDTGYGENNEALLATCIQVKADHDLNLDPIYGARSWQALMTSLEASGIGETTLFWHCGFTPDWQLAST